ncbi:MAG: FAD-dependent thymidylate synthase, partial [Vicinamibacterales bacterium]
MEVFSPAEQRTLAPFFTNTDRHVFALTNLPETVKGALFARYSRSAKSLRRLFLDEFAGDVSAPAGTTSAAAGAARADKLYAKVFGEYGDDSVAQLGGAHIACEYVSNLLTKVLERGRVMAYLEQSTRYVPYTDKLDGRWRYHAPAELSGAVRDRYVKTMDAAFETYAALIPSMQDYFARRFPRASQDSESVHRAATRAKALDTLRGLLPAATQSNVGIFGTGQAFESLLLRMRAHPLEEMRACAGEMLVELRKVIPAFLTRVDQPERCVR